MSLGITPVLAAPSSTTLHCLSSMYEWLADWQLRSMEAAVSRDADRRELGHREYRSSAHAIGEFETHWQHGGSPQIRSLIDSGVIELLGGPLAHPFQPLLDPRLRRFSLREGLADATQPMAL